MQAFVCSASPSSLEAHVGSAHADGVGIGTDDDAVSSNRTDVESSNGSAMKCWVVPHAVVAGVVAAVALVFVPTAMRVASVGGDLARVAVYFWTTLEHDRFDASNTHMFSQR